ncbi:MAG: PDZ domain-containing protein [Cyclobacteriaceae bacterium]|nr:PD40 domain-containing protein [Cyclobacteriaceae bacterium]MCH8515027.1 PDZ domain-containing protein [Cyclobacteriaceae bacterium]
MKKLLFCFLFLTFALSTQAQEASWMRYSAISPDGSTIAFTYKGDLFTVASGGGDAHQLTFHEAHDYMPVWSPDGKQIAFASDRYGNFDLFIMAAQGGAATRLTYHSNDESPFAFTPDGKHVVFGASRLDIASHRQYPTGSQPELYQVPTTGGRVSQLLTIPAEQVSFSSDGKRMLYHDKKGGENEWRKYHTSAITRDIWLYDAENNTHQQLTTTGAETRMPVFARDEDSFYYLSEESGNFNVHKASLENVAASTQLTKFELHPVRFLSVANNGLISFGYDGQLYTMREGEEPQRVNVTIRTQSAQNPDERASINGQVREMSISPDGKEVAFISRGEVFVTSTDGKLTKRITSTPEQEKFVTFGPEGKSIVYARERDGKWGIYQSKRKREEEKFFFASTLIEEEELLVNENENYLPQFSPDGKKMAWIENRRELKVMDLESKESVSLLTSKELFHMRDGDQYFTWSPDSKWLLAVYRPTMSNGEVVLLDASGKKEMKNLTLSGYSDFAPKWVNEGKQMLWFSNRDGLKSFATSGGSQSDVYTLFFDREEWEKFQLDEEEFKLYKEMKEAEEKNKKEEDDKKKKKKKDKEKEEDKDLKFDWDGWEDRKSRLTIHSSSLTDAVLSKDGEKLYYLARFEKGLNLWSTELRTKKTKMEIKLDARSGSLMWDEEMKNLFLLSDGSISKIDLGKSQKEAVPISSEMEVDRDAERAHLFEHVWIRNKGIFYTPDMHGADWDLLKTEYEKYLPHIGNSYEFAELLSELLGELNVSHAGARFNRSIDKPDATAALGIFFDYDYDGDGVKITEIISGGPLDRSGLDIKAGSIIRSIDGVNISKDHDWVKLLNRKAGNLVALGYLNDGDKEERLITVKPISLGEESRLLYRRWVRKNRDEVEEKSGGKLGYVHIPGMSDGPYRSTYEEMMGRFHDKDAVIVDTRFNGGGDLVADLAMFFTGEKFLTYATEEREVGYEPTFRWTKPTLAMFNEANYSDGHCFACGYTDLKIGKTLGMPVPGTCSFAGWEALSDGTRWGSVPISAKNKAGEWLENNQTEPEIKVKNMPGKIDKGIDEQLERAVEELLKEVE